MNPLQALIRKASVHERHLDIKTYPLENNQVLIEGWLRDRRLMPGYTWDGKPSPPGVVHWMGVRLLIGELAPDHSGCRGGNAADAPPAVSHPAGHGQKSDWHFYPAGFSNEIRERLGGIEGCSHITHLILAMGPAALHGFWAQQTREPRPVPRTQGGIQGAVPSGQQLPALAGRGTAVAGDGGTVGGQKKR